MSTDPTPLADEKDDTTVKLARKSYDFLIRTRDRARMEASWERQAAEHARQWAEKALDEQCRLSDRLNAVCAAAASLGVPIDAINAALDITYRPAGGAS